MQVVARRRAPLLPKKRSSTGVSRDLRTDRRRCLKKRSLRGVTYGTMTVTSNP